MNVTVEAVRKCLISLQQFCDSFSQPSIDISTGGCLDHKLPVIRRHRTNERHGTPHRFHNRFIHFLFNKQQSIRILMSTSHRVSQCTRTEISTDIIVPLRSVFFHRSHCSNIFGETRAIAALPGEAERKYLPTEGSDNKCLPPEEWLTSPISASAPALGSPLGLCVGRGGRGRSGPGSEV